MRPYHEKNNNVFSLSPCSFYALSTGINRFHSTDLVNTSVLQVLISIGKEEREGRREQEMDGQRVVVEESDGVMEEGLEL